MRANVGSVKLVETTRITLIVTDTKDSNHVTYSFVTKKAHALNDPGLGYEKKMVISKTDSTVILPAELYAADTIYLIDMGVKGKQGKKPYGTVQYNNNPSMKISGSLESGKFDLVPKTYSVSGLTIATNTDFNSAHFNMPMESGYKVDATIKKVSVGPKTSVTTPAGKFDCYKITVVTKLRMLSLEREIVGDMYFSDQYGVIKTVSKDDAGLYELIRVKN